LVIEVVRIGQRLVRDDRVTTHVALVSRAFGAKRIFMTEVNSEIKESLEKINKTWGGNFVVEFIDKWKSIVKEKKLENSFLHLCLILHQRENCHHDQHKILMPKHIFQLLQLIL